MKWDKWFFLNKNKSNAMSIPGFRSACYMYSMHCGLDAFGIEGQWISGVIVYSGANDLMFEFVIRKDWEMPTLISPCVIKEIYSKIDFSFYDNPYGSKCKGILVELNGRMLIKVNNFENRGSSITLNTIDMSIPGKVTRFFGRSLIHLELLKEHIHTVDDALKVRNAMEKYVNACRVINRGYYEKEKDQQFDLIREMQNDISNLNKLMSNICEEAADSLNILSTKYGIDVDIDEIGMF